MADEQAVVKEAEKKAEAQTPAAPPQQTAEAKPAEAPKPAAVNDNKVLGRGLEALIPPNASAGVLNEPKEVKSAGASDEDLKRVLVVIDDLLGKLPDNVIEEFSRSKDFGLYDRILKKYGL